MTELSLDPIGTPGPPSQRLLALSSNEVDLPSSQRLRYQRHYADSSPSNDGREDDPVGGCETPLSPFLHLTHVMADVLTEQQCALRFKRPHQICDGAAWSQAHPADKPLVPNDHVIFTMLDRLIRPLDVPGIQQRYVASLGFDPLDDMFDASFKAWLAHPRTSHLTDGIPIELWREKFALTGGVASFLGIRSYLTNDEISTWTLWEGPNQASSDDDDHDEELPRGSG